MRKFLFTLFILIVLAGAGFYLGWAQAGIPPGSYGVLRSKTHGTDPQVIKDGEPRWVWYKLIPTNTETVVFTPRRVELPLNVSGVLSSGRQYAFLAGIDSDFTWRMAGEISFAIRPEALPMLTERENLADDADLRAFEGRYAVNIESFIQQYLGKLSGDDVQMENLLASRSFSRINSEVELAFPEIKDFTLLASTVSAPDFNLYRAVRALYDEYLAQFHVALSNNALADVESRIYQRLRLDELTLMGELLTQFPILLDYLALERESAQ